MGELKRSGNLSGHHIFRKYQNTQIKSDSAFRTRDFRWFQSRFTFSQECASLNYQIMKERKEYYAALERCSTGNGDITPWLLWFPGCFSRAIERSEKKLAIVIDKARFWQRHAQDPLSDRQRKVINRLLDSGRGGFEGGLTTRKYVALADVSRATAFREIEQLLKLGILVRRSGGGRSVSYDVKWEDVQTAIK
jgi:Fic family protein